MMCGFCAADSQGGEVHSPVCVSQRLTANAVAAAYRVLNRGTAASRRVALEVLADEARRLVDAVRAVEVER